MGTCSRPGQSKASQAGRIFKRQVDRHDRAECNASGVYGYTMGFQWSGYTSSPQPENLNLNLEPGWSFTRKPTGNATKIISAE